MILRYPDPYARVPEYQILWILHYTLFFVHDLHGRCHKQPIIDLACRMTPSLSSPLRMTPLYVLTFQDATLLCFFTHPAPRMTLLCPHSPRMSVQWGPGTLCYPPPLLEVIGGEGIQGCSSRVGENIERGVVILGGEYIQGGNSGSWRHRGSDPGSWGLIWGGWGHCRGYLE